MIKPHTQTCTKYTIFLFVCVFAAPKKNAHIDARAPFSYRPEHPKSKHPSSSAATTPVCLRAILSRQCRAPAAATTTKRTQAFSWRVASLQPSTMHCTKPMTMPTMPTMLTTLLRLFCPRRRTERKGLRFNVLLCHIVPVIECYRMHTAAASAAAAGCTMLLYAPMRGDNGN